MNLHYLIHTRVGSCHSQHSSACMRFFFLWPSEVKAPLYADAYLIREEFQQERAQKNHTQVLWIQLGLHQTDAEKEDEDKEPRRGAEGSKAKLKDPNISFPHQSAPGTCFGQCVHAFMSTVVQLNIPFPDIPMC